MDGISLDCLDPFNIEDNEGFDWGLLDSLLLNRPGGSSGWSLEIEGSRKGHSVQSGKYLYPDTL